MYFNKKEEKIFIKSLFLFSFDLVLMLFVVSKISAHNAPDALISKTIYFLPFET
jgi:hypothetical protein